jgi:hypothetical protein
LLSVLDRSAVAGLVAVDSARAAVFGAGTHSQRRAVARKRERRAERSSGSRRAARRLLQVAKEPVRPFYLIGHNTNSLAEVRAGLERGLNAFEVDIHKDDQGRLYVSHDPVRESWLPGGEPPPRIAPFLADLRRLADSAEGGAIALVIFDCKVAEPELASELLEAVRSELTERGTSLHVIFSVPWLSRAETFFERIHGQLTDHEALMIDEEDDPQRVAAFFAEKQVARAAYGNGIITVLGLELPSPSLRSQLELAVALAAVDKLRFVYPWVLVAESTIREFVRIGVNGVMVDVDHADTLARLLGEPEFVNQIRPAARRDDPLALTPGREPTWARRALL